MSISSKKNDLNGCIEKLENRDEQFAKDLIKTAKSYSSKNDTSESIYDSLIGLINDYLSLHKDTISKIINEDTKGIPISAIKLIQEFEGLADIKSEPPMIKAYPDPNSQGEPYTIGWGTTIYPNGKKVKIDDVITKAEADQYFIENLKKHYWDRIKISIPNWDEMTDEMHAALCSFAYKTSP